MALFSFRRIIPVYHVQRIVGNLNVVREDVNVMVDSNSQGKMIWFLVQYALVDIIQHLVLQIVPCVWLDTIQYREVRRV